jgi:hypothetical protein
MMTDMQTANKIVSLLNFLLELDRPAVATLISARVPCNALLAEHPTVQCVKQHGGYNVSVLGLLNGICGIAKDGNGLIEAQFGVLDESTEGEPGRMLDLIQFRMRGIDE